MLVDPGRPALELARHSAFGIVGPDRLREVELGVIRALDGVVDIAVGDHRQHGTERVLVSDCRLSAGRISSSGCGEEGHPEG